MSGSKFPLLFVNDINESINFSTPGGGNRTVSNPIRNRIIHGQKLKEQFESIWKEFDKDRVERFAAGLGFTNGICIEFRSAENFDLIIKSLEDMRQGIRVNSVREIHTETGVVQAAVVYIPIGKESFFIRKISEYLNEGKESPNGQPRNNNLISRIEDIKLAVLESFWQGKYQEIPNDVPTWVEAWIRIDENKNRNELRTLRSICQKLAIEIKEEVIAFPERRVVLINVNKDQLNTLIKEFDFLAELRPTYNPISHWIELSNFEQQEWVERLLSRLSIPSNRNVSVLILDTGINNGHKLISPFLADQDMHTFNPEWNISDHDGHGTLMAGLAIYNDLNEALLSSNPISINHILESGKVMPPRGQNDKELYGAIISEVISKAEIQAPSQKRIICLAISEDSDCDGEPSSWSGAVDAISSGYLDDNNRLILSASGNIWSSNDWAGYPFTNEQSPIESPNQAWNIITVGAYTNKVDIVSADFQGYQPIAPAGGLSPFSKTSFTWDNKWPIKPEVLFEGGNAVINDDGLTSECDDLSLLSTNYETQKKQFEAFNMTSAATAKAANFAANIQSQYPNAWPETVRGLMVHSASWNEIIKSQFLNDPKRKTTYIKLLRTCGYGIPNLNKALYCSENYLTLVAQEELQPFTNTSNRITTKDMHFYEMPWPEDLLLNLGSTPVKLKVTLSYFIEPSPGKIGWKDKYRYRSHALGFDVNNTNETRASFQARINEASKSDDIETISNDSKRWAIGSQNRSRGSLHSDFIEATAADLSTCKYIGIFPQGGWWKDRKHLERYNRKTRYCLIVSLETPEIEIDLYTPVANKMQIPIITL